MKQKQNCRRRHWPGMPPTRGHDLKLISEVTAPQFERMPPTRGHDLKPCTADEYEPCARRMPPTRGHDLKRLEY